MTTKDPRIEVRASLFAWLDSCTKLSPAARYAFLRLQTLGAAHGVPLSTDEPTDRVAFLLPDAQARLVYEQDGMRGAWGELIAERFVYAASVRPVPVWNVGEVPAIPGVSSWWAVATVNADQVSIPTLGRYRKASEPPG